MTREEAVIILDGFKNNPLFNGQHFEALDMAISALSENKGEWVPITYRPMTDEEKEHYSVQVGCDKEDLDTMLDCRLPDDGEEVLITVFGEVETDIFYRDVDGCSFENRDIEDVRAWMPLPEPYKAKRGE